MIEQLYQQFLGSDGVSIDTRKLIKNQIFFALPGEKTDGNLFAQQALDAGALAVVVQNWKKPLTDQIF